MVLACFFVCFKTYSRSKAIYIKKKQKESMSSSRRGLEEKEKNNVYITISANQSNEWSVGKLRVPASFCDGGTCRVEKINAHDLNNQMDDNENNYYRYLQLLSYI